VRDAQFVELPENEDCCGFGGIFSMEHPELSAELLRRKMRNIERSGAEVVVVTEPGCMMHVAGGLRRSLQPGRVLHLAQILAKG
jgi:Fe-S oxidoreductase